MRLRTLSVESSRPPKAGHPQTESNGEETLVWGRDEVGQEPREGSEMDDTEVPNDQVTKRSNSEQERGDRAHDHDFVAGNTHVPQRKVCQS